MTTTITMEDVTAVASELLAMLAEQKPDPIVAINATAMLLHSLLIQFLDPDARMECANALCVGIKDGLLEHTVH